MRKESVSVVVPVYNEEESLEELYKRLKKSLKNYRYEIIFIDDGSTDNSFKIIEKIKKKDKNIKIIKFIRNFGKSSALDAGFKKASGEYVVTIDADLQDHPEEIPGLIEELKKKNIHVISGWRYKRKDSFLKKIASKIFNFFVSFLTGVKLHDINCGLKVYVKDAVKHIRVYGAMHRFIPVLLNAKGYKCGEKKVEHSRRRYGKSKYGPKKAIIGLLDLFTVLFLINFMKKPLHLFGTAGLICELGGGVILGYIVSLKIRYGTILSRHPLLIFGVLLVLVGLQFISIGLIGELVVSEGLKTEDYIIEKEI